ncbi:TetR-like C-terminal domain-containing protein [Streptomyces sp. NPDC001667]
MVATYRLVNIIGPTKPMTWTAVAVVEWPWPACARSASPLEEAAAERLRAAQAQGQLDPSRDPHVLIDLMYGALYYALLLVRKPTGPAYVDTLLETTLHGWLTDSAPTGADTSPNSAQ